MSSMKYRNTFVWVSMALLGFASCEMKDELVGNGGNPSDMGLLEVGVAVNSKVNPIETKASDDEVVSTTPSADGFTLEIINGEGFAKEYTYDASQESNAIEVPVGEYTVYAHTPGDLEVKMDAPYYGGKEVLSVKKGMTSKADVICKMENTKIQLTYSAEFLTTFASWNITITDGTSAVAYTQEDKNPAATYWLIADQVKTINVDITATTTDGKKVSDSRRLSKPEGSSEYWEGNDALTITVTPGSEEPTDPDQPVDPEEPEDPNGVKGIEIKVDGEFGDLEEEVVDVPVTPGDDSGDGGDEGDGGEDGDGGDETPADEPTITIPQSVYTLPADASKNADAVIKADAGIKSVKVQIVAGNTGFAGIVEKMFGTEPFELIGNETLASIFEGMGIQLPNTGDLEYTFPVGQFFSLLSQMGVTTGDGHVFNITVEDANSKTASNSLNVKVTE